jgi:glycosyltransferase involved in cell wall biosynthesis
MNLAYVTRVNVSSTAAQARQVRSMARAFGGRLGDHFVLKAPGDPTSMNAVRHEPLKAHRSEIRCLFAACGTAVETVRGNPGSVVFTRDVAVAFATVLSGGRAIYEAHRPPAGRVARRMVRALARRDRFRLVAISAALADHYQAAHGVPRERVLVAHDGVFPEEYDNLRAEGRKALRERLSLPQDQKVIVHTGSLYKGGAEYFGNVTGAGGEDVLFLQIGGSEAERTRWQDHYRRLGATNVQFLPHQPHALARAFQVAADGLFYVTTKASPIYWCTSPLKIFEYMAAGVPILASCIGSVGEVLSEHNAFCYDPESPETLARATARLLQDGDAARARASVALEEARERYSWHARADRIIDFAATLPAST